MHHYRESGLQNVWLRNGYRIVGTPYGEAIEIEKVEQLHRAIARAVQARPRLSGKEFRFLRTEMNLSQEALAQMIGNSAQSVALWEKGRGAPKWADRLMRALYREHVEGNANLKEIFVGAEENAEGRDGSADAKIVRVNFEKARGGKWRVTGAEKKAA
ncbi:MAG TPA: helix-turn-helix domain-containing protein [Rhizomicrobium sp.]